MTAPTDAGIVELIERLEKAAGGSRELSMAIPPALGFVWNGRCIPETPMGQWEHPDGRTSPDLAFSESIDAALTLVPEGWRCGFEDGGMFDNDQTLVEAWCWPSESSFDPDWQNGEEGYRSSPDGHRAAHKSRAIAIVLAALRARSAA